MLEMVGQGIHGTSKGERVMSFLCGLFVGSASTILFVAMCNVGADEKKLEDKEQEEWLRERRKNA